MIAPSRTDESFLADKAAQNWTNIIMRSSVTCPTDIDDILMGANPLAKHKPGKAVFPETAGVTISKAVKDTDRPTIAVLLDDAAERTANEKASDMAIRYAALAVEKECDLVILSHQNNAGFERFGFRVERIAGKTQAQRQACIEQLLQFWGAEIVI